MADKANSRDPIAMVLGEAGYEPSRAGTVAEAKALLKSTRPHLMILTGSDGLNMLEAIRADGGIPHPAVIMLAETADRQSVLAAAQMGVRDYLIKSRVSQQDLLRRVAGAIEREGKTIVAAPVVAQPGGDVKAAAVSGAGESAEIPRLLTQEECLGRIRNAPPSKALSGVAGQVMQAAASPRADASQIASIIARDPSLSAKILRAANSAAYASVRGPVMSVSDAIKQVGCTTVRNIAAAIGLMETFPAEIVEGFDPIRSWQHSFGVATLCETLAGNGEEASIAYMVGLCHELGEMLYYSIFGAEHQQCVLAQARTGKPAAEVQQAAMGMTQHELVGLLLGSLELPDAIRAPIEAIHAASVRPVAGKLARILSVADAYANGMLLAASGRSVVTALTQAECKSAVGDGNPAAPKREEMRARILVLTGMMSGAGDRALSPIFGKTRAKVWLARDASLSAFDPVEAAVDSLGEYVVSNRLPNEKEVGDIGGVVVSARTEVVDGMTANEIGKIQAGRGKELPVFWMVKKLEGTAAAGLRPVVGGVALEEIQRFLGAIK